MFNAPPEQVYITLTNPATIQLWTGEPAEMGSISGKNLEFIENKKIVQEWYFGDQEEQSIVTITLHADKGGTSLELRHTNIPDHDYDDIVGGWNELYFGSLRDFFD